MRYWILSLLIFSASIEGLLPPAWQGVAELKAILDSDQLSHYLNSADVIQSIDKKDNGWLITTNHGSIHVDVETERTPYIGPRKFSLSFRKD